MKTSKKKTTQTKTVHASRRPERQTKAEPPSDERRPKPVDSKAEPPKKLGKAAPTSGRRPTPERDLASGQAHNQPVGTKRGKAHVESLYGGTSVDAQPVHTRARRAFQVSSEDIERFDEDRFKEFMKALLRAESARLGASQSAVTVGDNTKEADGGADARTMLTSAKSSTLIPAGEAIWQFKAERRAPTRAEFLSELSKPEPIRCLKNGGSYVFAAQLPRTSGAVERKAAELRSAAKARRLPTSRVHFKAQSALEAHAWPFPSLAREFSLRAVFGDLKAGVEWARQPAMRRRWHPAKSRAAGLEEVITWARAESDKRHVRVIGPAGVGKTRQVFEALQQAGVLDFVVYASGRQQLPSGFVAGIHGRSCILVVDECRDEELMALLDDCASEIAFGNLRLISIGHYEDEMLSFGQNSLPLNLRPLEESDIAQVVRSENASLPDERVAWVAQATGGFVKLALLVSDAMGSSASGALDDLELDKVVFKHMKERMVGEDGLTLLQAIALFPRLGVDEPDDGELGSLLEWLKISPVDAHKVLRSAETREVLARVGSFRYVTPELLATLLARRFIHDAQPAIQRYLRSCPSSMLERASTYLAGRAPGIIDHDRQRLVASLLEDGGPFASAAALSMPGAARALERLSRLSPERVALLVERIVERDPVPELGSGLRHVLRTLVELLWSEDTFSSAFRAVFRLALFEREPGIANNATGILNATFLVYVPPTKSKYALRVASAKALFDRGATSAKLLLLNAMCSAFDSHAFGIIVPEAASREGLPTVPETDAQTARRLVFDFLVAAGRDSDAKVVERAHDLIVEHLRAILASELAEEGIRATTRLTKDPRHSVRIREAVEQTLGFDSKRLTARQADLLRSFHTTLPADLEARLRSSVVRFDVLRGRRVEAGLDEPQDAVSLAKEVVESAEADSLIGTLFDVNSRNPGQIAFALGGADMELKLLDSFLKYARSTMKCWIAGAYVGGAISGIKDGAALAWAETSLQSEDHVLSEIAARALSSAEGSPESLRLLETAIESGRIQPASVAGIAYGGWTRGIPPGNLESLLLALGERDGGQAIALTVASMAIHNGVAISDDCIALLVAGSLESTRGNDFFDWLELATRVVRTHGELVASTIIAHLARPGESIYPLDGEVSDLFDRCLRQVGPPIAEALLKALVEDGRYKYRLLTLLNPTLVEILGSNRVFEWASTNGKGGQIVLGYILSFDPNPATVAAIERFGADSTVAEVLAARFGSGVFHGDVSSWLDARARRAEVWATQEDLPAEFRRWARIVAAQEASSAAASRERDELDRRLRARDRGEPS